MLQYIQSFVEAQPKSATIDSSIESIYFWYVAALVLLYELSH